MQVCIQNKSSHLYYLWFPLCIPILMYVLYICSRCPRGRMRTGARSCTGSTRAALTSRSHACPTPPSSSSTLQTRSGSLPMGNTKHRRERHGASGGLPQQKCTGFDEQPKVKPVGLEQHGLTRYLLLCVESVELTVLIWNITCPVIYWDLVLSF